MGLLNITIKLATRNIMTDLDYKKKIIEILRYHSNPWGYQICGEDSFDEVADDIIKINNKNEI